MVYVGKIQWFSLEGEFGFQQCEVRIERKEIEVSAIKDTAYDPIVYEGKEVGPGHYVLYLSESTNIKGPHATLHRLEKSTNLEGSFICDGEDGIEDGMWRIELGEVKGKKG